MTVAAPVAGAVGVDAERLAALMASARGLGWTIATAESLTAGLLTAVLTEIPGSSAVVRGGLVVYATELKHDLAGVDRELLDRVGPVDPDVAAALAEGARRRCGATHGLGLTGVAGPDPQGGVPVGTCFVALAGPDGTTVTALTAISELPVTMGTGDGQGRRAAIRARCVRTAIELWESAVNTAVSPLADRVRAGSVGPAE